MSIPIPGKNYTVVVGDSLSAIAAKAYGGLSHWPIIYRANLNILQSDDPNLIFPGEVIYIPKLADFRFIPKLPPRDEYDFDLLIGTVPVSVTAARIIRTMDTAADGWTATIDFTTGENPFLDDVTKPHTYADSFAFLGGKAVVSGPLYGVSVSVSTDGRVKNLAGFSYTVDAVDSTMRPPYEKTDVKLEDWANELVAPFGIKAIFEEPSGGKFDRVTAEPTETIFEHLAKLAAQRGLLISSDYGGNMVFIKAKTSGKVVSTLEESPSTFGAQGATEYRAEFDGRKRFSSYKAIAQTPEGGDGSAVAVDKGVSRPRFMTFTADDSISGELQKAANWKRSKQLADALTIPFPVSGWYDDNGELWEVNKLVSVKSETIFCPDGFTFLIREVEFIYETSGKSAVLKLVPPQVYSGEELVLPWE